jgi:hypothetical protein
VPLNANYCTYTFPLLSFTVITLSTSDSKASTTSMGSKQIYPKILKPSGTIL